METFVADPIDKWIVAGQSVVWCVSPSFGGSTTWGRPDVAATQAVVHAFGGLWSSRLQPQVDVILDARRVEGVAPDSLATLVKWTFENRELIAKKVRLQIGVIPRGIAGITLAGILPTLGKTHPFRVEHESLDAFRVLAGPKAGDLCAEIETIVEDVSGVPSELGALRNLIRDRHASLTVEDAARALSVSTRSLQRLLKTHSTSFVEELRSARLAEASELLRSSDDKISVIASRVGITEGALTQLFRDKLNCTPAEYRKDSGRGGDA
jgi:AraC-like DNA-binding protein